MDDSLISGNIGEHSELLAMTRIIVDGCLELGVPDDVNQESTRTLMPVFGVSRNPPVGTKIFGKKKKPVEEEIKSRDVYYLSGEDIMLISEPSGTSKRICSKSELSEASQGLQNQLIYWASPKFKTQKRLQKETDTESGANSATKALQSEHSQRILNLLGLKTLRAKSGAKSDLYLTIESSGKKISQGFSVKSQMGSKSCLVNHSGATIFRYEILNTTLAEAEKLEEKYIYNKASSSKKDSKKLKQVKQGPSTIVPALFSQTGVVVKFNSVVNATFRDSLEMIDSCFPEALAMVILQRFKTGKSKIADLVQEEDLRNFLISSGVSPHNAKNFFQEKLKDLLRKFALGMQAGSEWTDQAEVKGGWVLVIKQGKVVGYRFDSTDDFRNYLLEHTMIDTPSTSRMPKDSAKIGRIFASEGRLFFTLSLIVKFTQ
jgi:HpaII restriction endonuclease